MLYCSSYNQAKRLKKKGIVSIGVIDFDCGEKDGFLQHSVAGEKLQWNLGDLLQWQKLMED